MSQFRAMMLSESEGKVSPSLETLDDSRLPAGDVTVRIDYSTLNYKDGMILAGLGRLVRQYPHVPGIDFAGTVEASDNPAWTPGDRVILTGWRVGEVWWGGFAQKARVKGEWLVPLPAGLSTRQAMALGTAGLTAMLAVMALEDHGVTPATDGEVLVTGAAGGLGSVATAVLAAGGYRVAAATGRAEQHDYLRRQGASVLVDRAELAGGAAKPLLAERWAACVDSVGGPTLAHVLASLRLHGAVASCGNAAGVELNTTVQPLLLRGISVLGIDSAQCPTPRRVQAWQRLAAEMPKNLLDEMTTEAALADLPALGAQILKGQVRGRVVIDVNR